MEPTEDESIQRYAKQGKHCLLKTILPFENEWTCIACG